MKKVFALCGAVLLLAPALGSATSLTVQVEQGQLRSDPSFFSKIISKVRYRSSVDLVEERGAWRLVKYQQQQGWMHISALIKPNVKLSTGRNLNSTVSGKEVSLAGKGFDAEVERVYRKNHGNLNFSTVDKMEKIIISPSELEKFAADGDFSTVTR